MCPTSLLIFQTFLWKLLNCQYLSVNKVKSDAGTGADPILYIVWSGADPILYIVWSGADPILYIVWLRLDSVRAPKSSVPGGTGFAKICSGEKQQNYKGGRERISRMSKIFPQIPADPRIILSCLSTENNSYKLSIFRPGKYFFKIYSSKEVDLEICLNIVKWMNGLFIHNFCNIIYHLAQVEKFF